MVDGTSRLSPAAARALFPIVRSRLFLQHAGLSTISLRTRDAMVHAVETTCARIDWEADYQRDHERLRQCLAELIGAQREEIAVTHGTAHGLSLLARGLNWRRGDNIVSAARESPANVFPWTALKQQYVEVRQANPHNGRVEPEAVLRLIDSRTRCVALSLVQYWNGYRLDVATIGGECRRRGVLFVVDGSHGVGAVKIDVHDAQIDLLAATAGKWLLGPNGVGFCFVRRDLAPLLEPAIVGPGTVVIRPGVPADQLYRYHATARRFEDSVISWCEVAGFLAAVELLQEVGMDHVESSVLTLTEQLGSGLAVRNVTVLDPWPREPRESSGIVSFRHSAIPPNVIFRGLRDVGIIVRAYSDFVRVSPHFYNSSDEMTRVLEEIDHLIGQPGLAR